MVKLNCFRSASSRNLQDDFDEKARPISNGDHRAKTKSRMLRRHGSAESRSSTYSNDSISKLPPCPRVSDPTVDAMMMPVPPERPSRCLRLSRPKMYADIVESMKEKRGCRDWRNFAVFEADEIDMTRSAEEIGKRRAADYERKWATLNSFGSSGYSDGSVEDEHALSSR